MKKLLLVLALAVVAQPAFALDAYFKDTFNGGMMLNDQFIASSSPGTDDWTYYFDGTNDNRERVDSRSMVNMGCTSVPFSTTALGNPLLAYATTTLTSAQLASGTLVLASSPGVTLSIYDIKVAAANAPTSAGDDTLVCQQEDDAGIELISVGVGALVTTVIGPWTSGFSMYASGALEAVEKGVWCQTNGTQATGEGAVTFGITYSCQE